MLLQAQTNLALVTAVTSALIGLLSGWLAAYLKVKGENLATKEDFAQALARLEENTRTVERARSEITRTSSLDTELRQAVKQATTAIAALAHGICWLTWDCVYRERLDAAMVKKYDDEVHDLLPEIIGQLAVIAMLHSSLHARLSPLADTAFALDGRVGAAVIRGEIDLAAGLLLLGECYEDGIALESTVRTVVADLFAIQASAVR